MAVDYVPPDADKAAIVEKIARGDVGATTMHTRAQNRKPARTPAVAAGSPPQTVPPSYAGTDPEEFLTWVGDYIDQEQPKRRLNALNSLAASPRWKTTSVLKM